MNDTIVNPKSIFDCLPRLLSFGKLAILVGAGGCSNGAGYNAPAPLSAANIAAAKSACGKADTKGGTGGSLMYTAQLYGHDLKVYSEGGSGLRYECSLTQGVVDPNGSMTTPNGWWYVANGGGENVLIYRTKKASPSGPVSSLSDYNQYPTNVASNPSRQLVAVSNYDAVPSGNGGSVSIYLHRQATPARTLYFGGSGTRYGAGVTLSRNGDCYWATNAASNGTGTIVKFASCNGSPATVVSGIPKVGGLALDQSGRQQRGSGGRVQMRRIELRSLRYQSIYSADQHELRLSRQGSLGCRSGRRLYRRNFRQERSVGVSVRNWKQRPALRYSSRARIRVADLSAWADRWRHERHHGWTPPARRMKRRLKS
jgi:hypothetical protein